MKSLSKKLLWFFLLLSLSNMSAALDCSKAGSFDAKNSCQAEALRQAEKAVTQLYANIYNASSDSDKKLLKEGLDAWLKEKNRLSASADNLLSFHLQRLHYLAEAYKKITQPLVIKTLEDWKNQHAKSLDPVSELIVSSYLKGNIRDFIPDQDFYNDLNISNIEWTKLYALDPKTILVQVGINEAGFQGESISFLYKNRDFTLVKFPQYDLSTRKLIQPNTEMNDFTWAAPKLTIHVMYNGVIYECGITYVYNYINGQFILEKQTNTNCNEKEVEAIQAGKRTVKDLKTENQYSKD